MAQVTFVASPLGSSVNSIVLWASNGLTKSSLIATLEGGTDSAISMRPWPTSLLPSHAYCAPFITFLFTLSRCLRDLYTIHENQTTSPPFSLTLRGNEVRLPHFTSSAMHSRYWSAPCSRQILPALSAMRR